LLKTAELAICFKQKFESQRNTPNNNPCQGSEPSQGFRDEMDCQN